MTENGPERWARLDELYHAALEQPEEQRDAFLRSACGGDEALRREVRALIGFHGHEGFFDKSPAEIAARLQVAIEDPASGQAASAPGVGRLKSSDSIPTGGFTPGMILLGRYRIIGLLGRGGMGEVYRADDLKLGQPVALKFLPPALATDPVRREFFIAEVRITRGLAHPNICRVYDISDFEGRYFLSMEFVDGEDLASLIQRIGYLSNEKALDLARQLAAGLAAAHARGVLHRDLKPANIMIDGHGRVRITDFGIAVAAGGQAQAAQAFGTPAYMAPELFTGKGASARSDIYALGLILYEIYSGKKAFTAGNIAELREQKEGPMPAAPSQIREGVDPIVERVIMRCLDRDPGSRPQSAAQLAAALPGGDPLAAAIAAGETPSPEMVAASGLKEGIRPAVALTLLAVVIVGAVAVIALNPRTMFYPRAGMEKSPEVLVERARELLRKLGYSYSPADSVFDFNTNLNVVEYIARNDQSPNRWDKLDDFDAVTFWYRQSRFPIERLIFMYPGPGMTPPPDDPPLTYSEEAMVTLDGRGQLRNLRVIPRREAPSSPGPPSAPDFTLLFSEAGLDIAAFKPIPPAITPSVYADTRAAWQGVMPNGEGPVRVEAAAFQGKPVRFDIVAPWTDVSEFWSRFQHNEVWLEGVFAVGVLLSMIGGGLFFARRNLRLGRGDRRGAARLALLVLCAQLVAFTFLEHHVAGFWELNLVLMFIAGALLFMGFTWTLYIGLEPYVRRRWPQILVSWSRLLSGEWRDPLVGRDVLVGCAAGVTASLLVRLTVLAPAWLGDPPGRQVVIVGTTFTRTRYFIGFVPITFLLAILATLGFVFIVVLFRTLLRSDKLAFGAATLIGAVLSTPGLSVSALSWIGALIVVFTMLLRVILLMRVGLVAYMVTQLVSSILDVFPITFDTSVWYSGTGFAALAVVVVLTLYGFRTSLGSRGLFEPSITES
jgi:serine/threonine-protein kinase